MATVSFPNLASDRLLLRQISEKDTPNIYNGLSDKEVTQYYGVSFETLEATTEQMTWYKDLEQNQTGIWWAICSPDNEIFYGATGFSNLSKVHQKAEIGLWLLPAFWGKGLMQESFSLVCDYGFGQLGLNRIEGFVDSENKNCRNALKKLNFTCEGIMRESEIKNQKYLNIEIYAKLKYD